MSDSRTQHELPPSQRETEAAGLPAVVTCPTCGKVVRDAWGCRHCQGEKQRSRAELVGQVLEEKWVLGRELGQGGMGTVYVATELGLDREVAIKLLARAFAEEPEVVARFEREARILAKLEHPNLVPVYAVGRHGKQPFIVMKKLEGLTLSAYLEKKGRLSPDELLHLARQASAGLGHMHAQGVVHRDLKPGNLHVASGGHLTLLDLGIAHDSQNAMTHAGTLMGTPHYMSPEQIRGQGGLDGRSDQYVLAALVFELATGRRPFVTQNDAEAMREHLYSSPPLASELCPDLPEAFSGVLDRALSKDPDARFGTVLAFYDALAMSLGREPERPPGLRAFASGGMTAASPSASPAAAAAAAVAATVAAGGGGASAVNATVLTDPTQSSTAAPTQLRTPETLLDLPPVQPARPLKPALRRIPALRAEWARSPPMPTGGPSEPLPPMSALANAPDTLPRSQPVPDTLLLREQRMRGLPMSGAGGEADGSLDEVMALVRPRAGRRVAALVACAVLVLGGVAVLLWPTSKTESPEAWRAVSDPSEFRPWPGGSKSKKRLPPPPLVRVWRPGGFSADALPLCDPKQPGAGNGASSSPAAPAVTPASHPPPASVPASGPSSRAAVAPASGVLPAAVEELPGAERVALRRTPAPRVKRAAAER